jgi:DNA-binding beta-propeller fold protein YncE
VINDTTNKKITDIPVGGSPFAMSFNGNTKILYVTNLYSHTISEIYNNHLLAGISFNISPPSSGNIECNNTKIPNDYYLRVTLDKMLDCKANTNSGFLFSSCRSDFSPSNSNNTDTTSKISRNGNITANYIIPIQFTLPKQYWEGLTAILPVR